MTTLWTIFHFPAYAIRSTNRTAHHYRYVFYFTVGAVRAISLSISVCYTNFQYILCVDAGNP